MLLFEKFQNYQRQEREAAKLVKKQSTYKLLADEDDNDADNLTSTSRKSSTIPSSKSRKHFRRKADQDGEDDDDDEDVWPKWYPPPFLSSFYIQLLKLKVL